MICGMDSKDQFIFFFLIIVLLSDVQPDAKVNFFFIPH